MAVAIKKILYAADVKESALAEAQDIVSESALVEETGSLDEDSEEH